jgi:hypothetical protein
MLDASIVTDTCGRGHSKGVCLNRRMSWRFRIGQKGVYSPKDLSLTISRRFFDDSPQGKIVAHLSDL